MSGWPPTEEGEAQPPGGTKPSIAEVAAWLRRAAESREPIEDLRPLTSAPAPAAPAPDQEADDRAVDRVDDRADDGADATASAASTASTASTASAAPADTADGADPPDTAGDRAAPPDTAGDRAAPPDTADTADTADGDGRAGGPLHGGRVAPEEAAAEEGSGVPAGTAAGAEEQAVAGGVRPGADDPWLAAEARADEPVPDAADEAPPAGADATRATVEAPPDHADADAPERRPEDDADPDAPDGRLEDEGIAGARGETAVPDSLAAAGAGQERPEGGAAGQARADETPREPDADAPAPLGATGATGPDDPHPGAATSLAWGAALGGPAADQAPADDAPVGDDGWPNLAPVPPVPIAAFNDAGSEEVRAAGATAPGGAVLAEGPAPDHGSGEVSEREPPVDEPWRQEALLGQAPDRPATGTGADDEAPPRRETVSFEEPPDGGLDAPSFDAPTPAAAPRGSDALVGAAPGARVDDEAVPRVQALVEDDLAPTPGGDDQPEPDLDGEPVEVTGSAAPVAEPPTRTGSRSLASLFDLDLADLAARARSKTRLQDRSSPPPAADDPAAGEAEAAASDPVDADALDLEPAGPAGLDRSFRHPGDEAPGADVTLDEAPDRPADGDDRPGAGAVLTAAVARQRAKRKRYPRGQLKERIGFLRRVRAMLGVVVLTVVLGVAAGAAIGAFLLFLAFAVRSAISSS